MAAPAGLRPPPARPGGGGRAKAARAAPAGLRGWAGLGSARSGAARLGSARRSHAGSHCAGAGRAAHRCARAGRRRRPPRVHRYGHGGVRDPQPGWGCGTLRARRNPPPGPRAENRGITAGVGPGARLSGGGCPRFSPRHRNAPAVTPVAVRGYGSRWRLRCPRWAAPGEFRRVGVRSPGCGAGVQGSDGVKASDARRERSGT